MPLFISDQWQPWPYLSPFPRYDDLSVENADFSYPICFTPNLKKFALNWTAETLHAKIGGTRLINHIISFLVSLTRIYALLTESCRWTDKTV